MPEYPMLTMAELEAAWQRLTAPQEERAASDLERALAMQARIYASKPPHAATYGLTHR